MKNIFLIIFIIIAFLSVVIYCTRPAPDVVSHYSVSLQGLTLAQKKNICLAANRLNNVYIQPKKLFSFNLQTGPRTLENGFVPSRSILENNIINSVGGGICLVASCLYNAILLSDLQVIERHAHSKVVNSVPAGLDATVWYGINDFKFYNNLSRAILIKTSCDYNNLYIQIKGNKAQETPIIVTQKVFTSPYTIKVKVFKKINHSKALISENDYKL